MGSVEVPKTLADNAGVAFADFVQAPFDQAHVIAVLQIELCRCEDERDGGAEQQNPNEETRRYAMAPVREDRFPARAAGARWCRRTEIVDAFPLVAVARAVPSVRLRS